MSFADAQHRIEAGFIEPLNAFRQKTAALNTIHNESLTKLEQNISALLTGSDGQPAFKGAGADNLAAMISQTIQNEHKLSGSSSDPTGRDLTGRLGDAASKNEKYAEFLETALRSIQNAPETSTKGLDQATAGVGLTAGTLDTGAGAQLGLDIPWDVIAAAASLLALGLLVADAIAHTVDSPDQQRANAAVEILEQAVSGIKRDYGTIESANPLPPDPESPAPESSNGSQGPQGNYKQLILTLLGITAAGGIATVAAIDIGELLKNLPVSPNKKVSEMTPQELEQLKQYLSQELGCSPAQIQKILEQVKEKKPTAAQLAQLLAVLKVRAQLDALKQQAENSSLPGVNIFLKDDVNGDLNRINRDIDSGNWLNWNPSNVRGWVDNANSAQYHWQVAQTLNARSIESSQVSIGADVVSSDNIWYEVKNIPDITRGDNNYEKILEQLAKYADQQPDNARGIGVIIPPGGDHNLGTELLRDLKADNPKDPKISRLKKISIKLLPPNLPDIPGNRWCKLP